MNVFRPGDRVLVPWGLDDVLATVVDVFGPAGEPFVRVRLLRGEPAGAEIPVKAALVKPAVSGSIEVTAIRNRNGQLEAEVSVGAGKRTQATTVVLPREEFRQLATKLTETSLRSEFARCAAWTVASVLESGESLNAKYRLSPAEASTILQNAALRSAG
ncbi:MAG TPA: hypothetical protein VGP46_12310 [Acidimicrobiales bacterium]|jgi:hypothetical protein|nr:hypothetical protein [Acidimicrobiales bacterium]